MFFLAGLPLLIQSDGPYSNISAEEFLSNLPSINERVLAIPHEGMARLLHGCLFILQIRQWYCTWNAVSSIKNYFYQHQNITIIIKGESEACPISEIAIIILSLEFIGSFEAAAFSFTGLFFPPSRLSLLSSGRSLCCLPHFAPTASRKKRAAKNILSALSAMRNTRVDWR